MTKVGTATAQRAFSERSPIARTYRRYLVNELRTFFDLPGTPIRLTLREKVQPQVFAFPVMPVAPLPTPPLPPETPR